MSARTGAWLGLDIGTSSVKAVLVADDGEVLGRGSAPCATHRPAAGFAEQDPQDYLVAAAAASQQCGIDTRPPDGVGLVGQTPTLILVDRGGTPVRPAMTWQDQRATREARDLADKLGDPFLTVGTSLPWNATALPAKLLWLARHEAISLQPAALALQPKDFIGMALTGDPSSDPWSSKGLCHVVTHKPCLPVLDLVGVPDSLVPPIRDAWSMRGTVTGEGARWSGITVGTPVGVGWSDALGGMLAVGAFTRPSPFALTGTSDIVGLTLPDGPDTAEPLYSVPSSCAPMTVVYGPTSTSGAALVWLSELLDIPVPGLVELAAGLDDQDEVPTFLPYLDGERAPIWRSDVAAAFVGLRHWHRKAHLARAVMTGIAGSERHVLDVAAAIANGSGAELDQHQSVQTAGVGSSHRAWQQIRTSTFARPVTAYEEPALTAVAAAMLAAAAAKGDLASVDAMRPLGTTTSPAPEGIQAAQTRYARYRQESEHACATTT